MIYAPEVMVAKIEKRIESVENTTNLTQFLQQNRHLMKSKFKLMKLRLQLKNILENFALI
jgi:hypothetical protein